MEYLPPAKQQAIRNMANASKKGNMEALKDLLVLLQFNRGISEKILEGIYFSNHVTSEQKQLIISRFPSMKTIIKQHAIQQMITSAKEGSFEALKDLVTLMKRTNSDLIELAGEVLVEIFLSDKSTSEQKAFLWANKDIIVKVEETYHEGYVDKDYPGYPEQSERVWEVWTETEYISLYQRIVPYLGSLKQRSG